MMDSLISWFEQIGPVKAAFIATLFTWGLTAAGASLVFFFKSMHRKFFDAMLGFTGGVMVAASFWSLLSPAIEMSEGDGFAKVLPAAVGFGLGLAVSMPLRRQGVTSGKSFMYGQLSAVVEPVAGVLGALLVMQMRPILPYALAFAAGAMIYVVVEEVIPETQRDKYTDLATLGFIGGFIVMMSLDVGLG